MLKTDTDSALFKSRSDGGIQYETKNNPLQSVIWTLKKRSKWEIQAREEKDQKVTFKLKSEG